MPHACAAVASVTGSDIQVIDNWTGAISQHSFADIANSWAPDGQFTSAFVSRIDSAWVANNVPQNTLSGDGFGDYAQLTTWIERITYNSSNPAMSADGRYVAFESRDPTLIHGFGNFSNIYLYDRVTDVLKVVSTTESGAEPNRDSIWPHISADGQYIAFTSNASNLLDGGVGMFIYDNATGTMDRIPRAMEFENFNLLDISADGRSVLFKQTAWGHLFVYDRATQTMDPVGVLGLGNGPVAISADFSCIAFWSADSNLVAGDTNNAFDVFIYDRASHTTERIALGESGGNAIAISADGRHIAFATTSAVVSGDDNNLRDIYVYDRVNHAAELVSQGIAGADANNGSYGVSISADGRYIAFDSAASNLVPNDTNDFGDAFIYDRLTHTTQRVSVPLAGGETNSSSFVSGISPDGQFVLLSSNASNLVADNINGGIFVVDRTLVPGYQPPNQPFTSTEIFDNQGELAFLAAMSKAAYHLITDDYQGPGGQVIPGEREDDDSNDNDANDNKNAEPAYTDIDRYLQLLDESDLPLLAPVATGNANFPFEGIRDGIYVNSNAAALVGRAQDALFVAFRGTNDNEGDLHETPDMDHWTGKFDHYALFADLVIALDTYLEAHTEITRLYVTGHSLGAAMVQPFIAEATTLYGIPIEAVTFATPGYGPGPDTEDSRVTNFWTDDDIIIAARNAGILVEEGSILGDINTLQDGIFDTTLPPLNIASHSMDLYLSIARFLHEEGIDLDDTRSLNGIDYDNIVMKVTEEGGVFKVGVGEDTLSGSNGSHDLMLGGADKDKLNGKRGSDTLLGGEGDDTLDGSSDDDFLDGGTGADTLKGGGGSDRLEGGEGSDKLDGESGADVLQGGAGDDTYYANNDDTVFDSGGADKVICNGSFTLATGNGVEKLEMRKNADGTLTANSGNLNGNELDNTIEGSDGANVLRGGAGDDRLLAYGGQDRLQGDGGRDIMTGGDGSDTFRFATGDTFATSTGYDTVMDFVTGADKIDLPFIGNAGLPLSGYEEGAVANSNSFASMLSKANQLAADGTNKVVFVAGATDGWLFWDTDGALTTMEAAVRLRGLSSLGAFDHADLI